LRLALSKGPNRARASFPSPEDGSRSSFRNAVFSGTRIADVGQSLETPRVAHPRQNSSDSTVLGVDEKMRWLSRCSGWLRAGRPRGRSSSPGRAKKCHFPISSRPALGPTQPAIQWVPGSLSLGVNRRGRESGHSPPKSAEVKRRGSVHPFPHTPSRRTTFPDGELGGKRQR
jgi:hypothetical protein